MLPLDAAPCTVSKSGLGSVKGPLDAEFYLTACLDGPGFDVMMMVVANNDSSLPQGAVVVHSSS